MNLTMLPSRIRSLRDRTMHLIRNIQHMMVRNPALGDVSIDERLGRLSAQHERKFPRQVVPIVQSRIKTFAAKGARKMGRVPNEEPLPIGQPRNNPPMHPKRREPIHIRRAILFADARHNSSSDFINRYCLDFFFEILKADPSSAWQRCQ
jgi:hypothetical protein